MSDKKISDLVELTTLAADDVLPVVDSSANATKRITGANLTTAVRGDTGTLTLGDGTAISSLGADSFRLTADATSNGTLTSWEPIDESTSVTLGSSVSESSGFFSVPSTGVYLILFGVTIFTFKENSDNFSSVTLEVDGSASAVIQISNHAEPGTNINSMSSQQVHLLTPSTSVRLSAGSVTANQIEGNTTSTSTYISFVRLGDA